MAREEAPGMIPGTSQKEDPPNPIEIDPEIGEGALLLGMIAAGDATDLSESRKGFAPVVATPMTGEGDKPCDGVFNGGGGTRKKLGQFLVNSRVKARKIPLIYWAKAIATVKIRYSATSK